MIVVPVNYFPDQIQCDFSRRDHSTTIARYVTADCTLLCCIDIASLLPHPVCGRGTNRLGNETT